MSNVVGERFQITIDKRIREQLGIKPGDRAIERVEDGCAARRIASGSAQATGS